MSKQDVAINQIGLLITFSTAFLPVFSSQDHFHIVRSLPKKSSWSNDQSNFVQFVCAQFADYMLYSKREISLFLTSDRGIFVAFFYPREKKKIGSDEMGQLKFSASNHQRGTIGLSYVLTIGKGPKAQGKESKFISHLKKFHNKF